MVRARVYLSSVSEGRGGPRWAAAVRVLHPGLIYILCEYPGPFYRFVFYCPGRRVSRFIFICVKSRADLHFA